MEPVEHLTLLYFGARGSLSPQLLPASILPVMLKTQDMPSNPLGSSQSEKHLLPPTPFLRGPVQSRGEVCAGDLGAGVEDLCQDCDREGGHAEYEQRSSPAILQTDAHVVSL